MQATTNKKQTLGLGYIRTAELAKLLSVSQATVWRWAKIGHLPKAVKLGPKVTAFRSQDIQAFMNAQGYVQEASK